MTVIGVDIGGSKTMMVCADGSIIHTDTGSMSRPTVFAFANRKRFFDEQAISVGSCDAYFDLLNILPLLTSLDEEVLKKSNPSLLASKMKLLDEDGEIYTEFDFDGHTLNFKVPQIVAMFLNRLFKRAESHLQTSVVIIIIVHCH